MKNILITGVTGFIGSALKERLLIEGYDVLGTSRNPKRADGVIKLAEINELTDWSIALNDIDVVVHLAGRAHVIADDSSGSSELFERTNHYGTKQLAYECVKYGVKRFIYISSIGVNGSSSLDQGFSEDSKLRPENCYAVSKMNAENALTSIANRSDLNVVIIRPPLVYGPGAKGNFLRLLKLVRKGVPIPIGNINNKRSMIGLTNLVDIICTLIKAKKIRRQVYLVSDGMDVSTIDFVNKICGCMNKKSIVYSFPQFIIKFFVRLIGKQREYMKFTSTLVIDSSELRDDFDWVPVKTIEQELEAAVALFNENDK